MALFANVSVAMSPEMVEAIDAARGSMARAEYIRLAIRSAEGTPFDNDDEELPDLSDVGAETAEAGGAA